MRTRLLFALLTAVLGLTVTFFLVRLMPGDVVHLWAQKIQAEQGIPYAQAYRLATLRLNYDPSVPLHVQYLSYVKGVLSGNLGESLYLRVPVVDVILAALPWTLLVASLSLLVSFTLGVGVGLLCAWRRSSWLEPLVTLGATLTQSVPDFLVALVLLIVFAINLRLFPLRGACGVDVDPGFNPAYVLDVLWHAALPVAAFSLQSLGAWALAARGSASGVLSADYMTMARAKGLKEGRIVGSYLGRNAVLPLVTSLAVAMGAMFSGAMLVETLFSYPGVGYFMAEALNNRDYTLLQGLFLVTTLATVLFTLLGDLALRFLDPRIK